MRSTSVIINNPITNATSDNLLIPALMPEIVDAVATAVMHQTIITYLDIKNHVYMKNAHYHYPKIIN